MRYIPEDGRWQEKRDQVSLLEEGQNRNEEEIAIVYVPKERHLDLSVLLKFLTLKCDISITFDALKSVLAHCFAFLTLFHLSLMYFLTGLAL